VSIIPSPSKFRDIGREIKPKNPRPPKSAYLCFEQVRVS
jgi:predicted alternative tryptophan synthase beta-subunit